MAPVGRITTSSDRRWFNLDAMSYVQSKIMNSDIPNVKLQGPNLQIPASPRNAIRMVELLQPADIEFDQPWMDMYVRGTVALKAGNYAKHAQLAMLPTFTTKTKPWEHQIRAYHFLRGHQHVGLFSDMGTGKTKVIVDLICNERPKRTLIVGPLKSVQDKLWEREFTTHGEDPPLVMSLSEGTIAKRAEAVALHANPYAHSRPVVIVINYDTLSKEAMQNALEQVEWDWIILDESHRIKASTGQRSKFLARFGKKAKKRIILTGTPNADKPTDVWAQYRFLDPTIFGTFSSFKARYCITSLMPNGRGGYFEKIEGYKDLDLLAAEMSRNSFRVTADVLELPEQHDVIRYATLEKSTMALYLKMEKEAVLSLPDDEMVLADNVLTKYLRMQEIANGYIRPDARISGVGVSRAELTRLDAAKVDVVLDILEDIGPREPVVIFYRFKEDARFLHEQIRSTGERHSLEVSGSRDDLQEWKDTIDRGEVADLLVNIASGAEAIDLTRSRYVIYLSTDFSLTHFEQSRKRVHRPGQTRPVTYFHILAKGTVDEYIYNALQRKENIAESITRQLIAESSVGSSAS